MKKYLLLLFAFFIISCDEDSGTAQVETFKEPFFVISNINDWDYDGIDAYNGWIYTPGIPSSTYKHVQVQDFADEKYYNLPHSTYSYDIYLTKFYGDHASVTVVDYYGIIANEGNIRFKFTDEF